MTKMLDNVEISNKILLNSIESKKLSHAYLFEIDDLDNEIVFSFVKKIICPNEYSENCEKCNICKRIDNGNYADLKIIKPDGMWIKKEQLINLQSEVKMKSLETSKMVYIIYEAEKMNTSAANTILKFLEEPEEGIIAILLTRNIHNVIDTIVSRCQIINYKTNNLNIINNYEPEMLENVLNFIKYLEFNKLNTIAKIENLWNNIFKQRDEVLLAFEIIFLFYFDLLKHKLNMPVVNFENHMEHIKEISNNNSANSLKRKINIISDLKNNIPLNVNLNLLMDKFIIDFSGVD